MRLTFFEYLMMVAVAALLFCVIVPRITSALPEVRASRATALAVRLDALTSQWLNAGGLAGPGEPDHLSLTRHMLECFTSAPGVPYTSPSGSSPVNYVGEPTAAPAAFRLQGFENVRLSVDYLPSGLRAIFIENQFAAVFDGSRWQVWPTP